MSVTSLTSGPWPPSKEATSSAMAVPTSPCPSAVGASPDTIRRSSVRQEARSKARASSSGNERDGGQELAARAHLTGFQTTRVRRAQHRAHQFVADK
jgi:hypothetical protein